MRAVVGILVVLIGCSGREDVVITGIDEHQTPTGLVKLPADMSNLRVQIYAGDERLPAVPVRGDPSGHIRVKGVPEGPFVIAVETMNGDHWWLASESHDVEWEWRYVGRLDARLAEVEQPIMLAVDGLAPWESGDALTAYSVDATTAMHPNFDPMLTVGSTSIQATFDWNAIPPPLLYEPSPTYRGANGNVHVVRRYAPVAHGCDPRSRRRLRHR